MLLSRVLPGYWCVGGGLQGAFGIFTLNNIEVAQTPEQHL